jgi:cytochrome c553
MKSFSITAFALAAIGATHANAAEPNPGRLLAAQCAQCHGTNGHAVKGESLAGKNIYGDVSEMKSKVKPEDIMHQQAKGYTDAELRLIGQYFSTVR